MNNRNIYPIDITTGEIVPGISMQDAEDRKRAKIFADLRRQKSFEQFLRKQDHKALGSYILSERKANQFKELDPQDVARLVYLAAFLDLDNNLIYRGRYIRPNDFVKLLGVSEATAKRFWRNVRGTYIIEDKDKKLTFCRTLFRGKDRSKNSKLGKVFIKSLRNLYKNTPVSKHKYLGYVFMLFEYVNTEYNILSWNPDEKELESVNPMTIKQFCEVIGYDPQHSSLLEKVYREIKFPTKNGQVQHLCAFVSTGNSSDNYIVLNPRIYYAGSDHEKVDTFALFFK